MEITNDPDGKIARENAERKAREKKAAEEKAAKKHAEKKAEEEKIEDQLPQKKKYIKCVCGKCGEVFYIELDKAVIIEM